jgi:hypothetical protein
MSKGSQRRPREIPPEDYDSAWDRIFGNKKKPVPPPPVSPTK